MADRERKKKQNWNVSAQDIIEFTTARQPNNLINALLHYMHVINFPTIVINLVLFPYYR